MPIDRDAAIAYARKYWNRMTDDGTFDVGSGSVNIAEKRKKLKAPASDGWEVFFLPDGQGSEDAVFRRTVKGKTEDLDEPIETWKGHGGNGGLNDCTHYVSLCLLSGGAAITKTARANELAEQLLKSPKTKALAVRTTRSEGQKVVDSGIFKPGDFVAYYKQSEGRYHHTAMYVGKLTEDKNDPGGITCHTLCRFRGLTKAWNGADDDDWSLGDNGDPYTLVHFSDDDAKISAATLTWLPGWWKVKNTYYYVLKDGRAYSTAVKPAKATQSLSGGNSVGYYFENGTEIVLIWRKAGGMVQVERGTPPPAAASSVALKIDGNVGSATRVFQ